MNFFPVIQPVHVPALSLRACHPELGLLGAGPFRRIPLYGNLCRQLMYSPSPHRRCRVMIACCIYGAHFQHVRSVRKMCNCNGVLCDLPHSTVQAPSIPPHPTNVLYDGDVVTLGASHLWRIGHVGKEVVSILVVIGSLRLSRHLHSKRAELAVGDFVRVLDKHGARRIQVHLPKVYQRLRRVARAVCCLGPQPIHAPYNVWDLDHAKPVGVPRLVHPVLQVLSRIPPEFGLA
mmetsp:Transcript_47109/g.89955  ORF Transcript_47109/g.89955 Transcript_47109/m.89955 type:complete len:233 (+) Transcript_47109:1082-1780(+)